MHRVDLHEGVPELSDRSTSQLFQRARCVGVGDSIVHTLSAEDQLRHLCLHFVRHGGWRPLWLCDIGTFIESLPGGFDWDYCLSGEPRLTAWVRAVLGLASRVNARRVRKPRKRSSWAKSEWLDRVILSEWAKADPGDSHSRDKTPFFSYLRRLGMSGKGCGAECPMRSKRLFGWTSARNPRLLVAGTSCG